MRRAVKIFAFHAIISIAAIVCLIPFGWMIGVACTRNDALHTISSHLTLDNFRQILRQQNFTAWLINSLFVACTSTVLVVMISALTAFALAKIEFVGKRPLMILLLITLFVPGQVLLPGSYELIWRLGWLNHFAALLVPASVNVLGVFLFRQAMLAVPDDLLHAARIDGCGPLRVWWDVMLPSIRPMIGAFTLLSFIGSWNSFLWPQVVMQDEQKFTIPMGLANLISAQTPAGYGPLMAGTLLSLIPVALLFFSLQRDFVAGLSGAIKE